MNDIINVKPNEIVSSTKWHTFACSIDNGIEPPELHPHIDRDSAHQSQEVTFSNNVYAGIAAQVNFANILGNFAWRLMKIHYTSEEMLNLNHDAESCEEFQKDFIERVNAFYYWLIQDPDYGMLIDIEHLELSQDNTGIPNNIKLLAAQNKLIWNMIVSINEDFIAICNDLKLPTNSQTSLLLTEISHQISIFKEKYVILR